MTASHCRLCTAVLSLCVSTSFLTAQQSTALPMRAPATPLVVHDPYFSLWSMSDRLTDSPVKHWTGAPEPMNGLIRIDGKTYRYLGNEDRGLPALEEVSREITPTRTIVTLRSPGIELRLTFLTPAFPDDLRTMARPVTYLDWTAKSRDGATHDVSIYLDADAYIATNDPTEKVTWSRADISGLHLLRIGTAQQPILQKSGDFVRIDWGYFYFGVPNAGPSELAAGNKTYRGQFITTGHLPPDDDLGEPREPDSRYQPAAIRN